MHETATSGIYITPPGGGIASQRQLALVASCGKSSARRNHSRTVEDRVVLRPAPHQGGRIIWGLLLPGRGTCHPPQAMAGTLAWAHHRVWGDPRICGVCSVRTAGTRALPKGILAVFDSPRSLPLLTSPCGPASHGGGVRSARRLAYHSPWWGFRLLLGKPVEMSRPRTRLP